MWGEILHWTGLILSSILVAALAIAGLIFSILPPIPGPILTLAAMFVFHYVVPGAHFEMQNVFGLKVNLLLLMSIVTVAVLVIENIIPMWATKKFGGSKAGIWGSTIGLLVGLFFLPAYVAFPFNLIIGLFAGAMIGELMNNNSMDVALKSGFGSFLGFLAGNGIKLAVSIIMCVQIVRALF